MGWGWSLVERIGEEYWDGLLDWSRAHHMQWGVGVTRRQGEGGVTSRAEVVANTEASI